MNSNPNIRWHVTLWRNYDFVKKELIEPTKATIPYCGSYPEYIIYKGQIYKQFTNPRETFLDSNYLWQDHIKAK